jgi:hypothetical protein
MKQVTLNIEIQGTHTLLNVQISQTLEYLDRKSFQQQVVLKI